MVFGIGYNPEDDAKIIIGVFYDLRKKFHPKFKTKKFFIGNDFVRYFKNDYVYEGPLSHKVSPTKRIPSTSDISFKYYANEKLTFHTMQLGKDFSFRCFYDGVDGFEAVMDFIGTKVAYRTTSFHPDYIDGKGTLSSRKATKLSQAILQYDTRFVDKSLSWDQIYLSSFFIDSMNL